MASQGIYMIYATNYFLIREPCDSCNQCLFIQHAFLLLQLPLKCVSKSELSHQVLINQQHTHVFYCCNTTIIDTNIIELEYISWISFEDNDHIPMNLREKTSLLPFPFSLIELENILCSPGRQAIEQDFSHPVFKHLIGCSKEILNIKQMIKQVSACNTNVLIMGESGTGKEVIASCIHALSSRSEKSFVPINCGAIPGELIESELFGHEKGAFSGASSKRIGRFEMADKGTLFLDEIGDMPFNMQVKLLRAIQEQKIERVGSNMSIDVNVQIISATNKNLENLIKEKSFREDLFYRINVFPITVPSLKDRREDIPLLIDHYIAKISKRLNASVAFSKAVIEILCEYSWPGNIRELMNFLERKIILYSNRIVTEKELPKLYLRS